MTHRVILNKPPTKMLLTPVGPVKNIISLTKTDVLNR